MTITNRKMARVGVGATALLACLASTGCLFHEPCRLLADTARPGGEFSAQRNQWAYDGETVTFQMECAPGAGHFVLFTVQGKDYVVETPQAAGLYRWTHVFRAGAGPQVYTVSVSPFLMRGKCDWVYNSSTGAWDYYPGATNKPDIVVGDEQTMKITCYRAAVRFRFKAARGRPEGLTLSLTRDTGQTSQRRTPQARTDDRLIALSGPDKDGFCEVTYAPTCEEVSRSGKTHAKLQVEYAGGETAVLEQDIDTP